MSINYDMAAVRAYLTGEHSVNDRVFIALDWYAGQVVGYHAERRMGDPSLPPAPPLKMWDTKKYWPEWMAALPKELAEAVETVRNWRKPPKFANEVTEQKRKEAAAVARALAVMDGAIANS